MPSTYAHYRFGQEVLKELPNDIKKIIIENKELYDIGLHGPDILFYYQPLKTNPINSIGYQMHEHQGKEFFDSALKIIGEKPVDEDLAYLLGFICHFTLDATCHGYIDQKIIQSGVSHGEIEVEFDRFLMIEDGLDPIRHKLTNHIIPSIDHARIIAPFFNVTAQQVIKALKSMKFYNDLLIAPSKLKRKFIYTLLRITGNYQEMHGLFVNYEANPLCKDSTEKLNLLYKQAIEKAVELISEYVHLSSLEKTKDDFYQYTFSGKKE